ncbi:terminase large subunit domain-containing protein [Zhihengliuella halotolerans]|uniref:Uncharacterized protein n=1 Tax=Zhihengliuella halotolerans TaxID=370736 RepID=A0A4Q8ABA5_9MICC|nr:terminase family protein [Zhihengliuella halotolerans]RZU61442.1 hypothetical protein EV380_1012 [Zhihengliuella halotolerans]
MSSLSTEEDSLEYWQDQLGQTFPRYSSPITPGAPNELRQVEMLARILDFELKPYQRYVVRVITEKIPGTDEYRWSSFLLLMPRQVGKTTLTRLILAARCLANSRHRIMLSAQSLKDARQLLLDFANELQDSVIGDTLKVRMAADTTRIEFHNKSRLGTFPPLPEALHGSSNHTVYLDEVFSYSEEQGNLVMGAALPTLQNQTDEGAQLLMSSTQGTLASTFLIQQHEEARKSLDNPESTYGFIEFSADPNIDPNDEESWWWHPGLATGLVRLSTVRTLRDKLSESEFIRTFHNLLTTSEETVVDMVRWKGLADNPVLPNRSQVAIGFEVDADRRRSAVAAAWRDAETGHIWVRIIRSGYGTSWLPQCLAKIRESRPLGIAADKHPQNNVIMLELQTFDTETHAWIDLMTPEMLKTASASFIAKVEDGTIHHVNQAGLNVSIAKAQRRKMGESFVFSHYNECELFAAISAIQMIDAEPPPTDTEIVFFDD